MLRDLPRFLSRKGRPGRAPLRSASRTRNHFRPAVEPLEDRRLLSASFVPDQVLLQFKPGVSEDVKGLVWREVAALRHESLRGGAGEAGPELVSFGSGRTVEDVIQRLRNNPAVAYAEPNWVLTRQAESNDLYY